MEDQVFYTYIFSYIQIIEEVNSQLRDYVSPLPSISRVLPTPFCEYFSLIYLLFEDELLTQ